jgi:hypothetical protein
MWHDTKTSTNLQSGGTAPVLALDKYTKGLISQSSKGRNLPARLNMPCLKVVECLSATTIAKFLDIAGKERFLAKVRRFQVDLAQTEAKQTLYQGTMEALGYSKNKLPFLELAHRLPLQKLTAQGEMSDEECLIQQQALLLGTAGLLPSQRPNRYQDKDEWIDKLERLWTSSHQTEVMPLNAWHLFRVRPNNFPARRIVAMSYLILRYRKKGLLEEAVNMVKEAPLDQGHHGLEEKLVVTSNGYWASHFDFSLNCKSKNQTLLGRRRAADIIVNVLLPFTFAWSKLTSQPELAKKASNLYHSYPRLAVNTVERHMSKQLGLSSSLVNSAQRQQGLIHIYNTLCTQGKCSCCPLSQPEAGNYI